MSRVKQRLSPSLTLCLLYHYATANSLCLNSAWPSQSQVSMGSVKQNSGYLAP